MRTLHGLIAGVGMLAAAVFGQSNVYSDHGVFSPPEWSKQVWLAAQQGVEATFREVLDRLPREEARELAHVRASIDLLKENIAKWEAQRQSRIAEVSAELDEHLKNAESDKSLSDALKSAVDLELLLGDRALLLADPRIAKLERAAASAARRAEAKGDWLTASELFSRLNVLFDREGTYRSDIDRQVQRLAMIRLYAPEKLWQMRNDRRVAEGEAALPAYNPAADTYQEKLDGVEEGLVRDAIFRASRANVKGVTMGDMLRGGLGALRVFATTPELHEIFPGLADANSRQAFLAVLDREEAKINQLGRMADQPDLRFVLSSLMSANRDTIRVPNAALLHEFGNGAMAALDEFSSIIWPDEIRRFERSTQGRFVGVGIQIRMDDLFNIEVVTPLEGQPAQRAGIRAGDIITRVNDISAIGLSLDQAVEIITGPAGTDVSLTVQRTHPDGTTEEKTFRITRKEIKLRSVKGWRRTGPNEENWNWFIDEQSRIGYVRLTQFHEDTTRELDRAIAQMQAQGVEALIVDLRFNPGGLLDQAVNVASRFIDGDRRNPLDGVIVSTQDGAGRQTEQPLRAASRQARLANIPIVVLVNESSASASEIVSGAIRDYAQAGVVQGLLIGQRTFGKGSVQNVWYLGGAARRAALKLTTQFYRLPGGALIDRERARHVGGRLADEYGVRPNMSVSMVPAQIIEALRVRQDADVVPLDDSGKPVAMDKVPDPSILITDGLDLQLQTAMVLLQTQVSQVRAHRAVLNEPPAVRTP